MMTAKETISSERIEQLNRDIEEGWNDLENGNYHNGRIVMKEIIQKYE